ncbi:MAG: etfA [Acidimicrobiales bacterium]|nr:etfA [Acidimicrobiales bacterium]
MFGTTYDGRDIAARLSVKLDKPVLTNNTDVEVGDCIVVSTQNFGGTQNDKTKIAAGSPAIALFRPKSFVAEESGGGAAEVAELAVPDTGAAGAAKMLDRHVEEHSGPKLDEAAVVVSGGRGLGEAG